MKKGLLIIMSTIVTMVWVMSSCNKSRETKKEGVYYTCPMHPQIQKDEPGNCPICGMNLVEKQK